MSERARRGALKTLQDARERGWTGRKMKTKEQEADYSAGWTDIIVLSDALPAHIKEKKCTVM